MNTNRKVKIEEINSLLKSGPVSKYLFLLFIEGHYYASNREIIEEVPESEVPGILRSTPKIECIVLRKSQKRFNKVSQMWEGDELPEYIPPVLKGHKIISQIVAPYDDFMKVVRAYLTLRYPGSRPGDNWLELFYYKPE